MPIYKLADLPVQVSGGSLSANSAFDSFKERMAPGGGQTLPYILSWKESAKLQNRPFPPLYVFHNSAINRTGSFGFDGGKWLFKMEEQGEGRVANVVQIQEIVGQAPDDAILFSALTNMDGDTAKNQLNLGFWVAFGIAGLFHQAVSVHSSVVVQRGKAVLFLGGSGTGKSTQSRLWIEHIPDTELLNDDTPFVRIMPDGEIRVYGFPMSGKTPCYKNKWTHIAAIVRLSQAPFNRLTRLGGFSAFSALMPSCPEMFMQDRTLREKITGIIDGVINAIPVYHLECLPDKEAAQMAYDEIFGAKNI